MAGSGTEHLRKTGDPLLRAERLHIEFPLGSTGLKVYAVTDVSLDVLEGETLGLVGESGCGKSTTGRALMQLPPPTSGTVTYDGQDLTSLKADGIRHVRPSMQMIFQDPISSLNPRRKVRDIVAEPLRIWAAEHNPPAMPTKLAAWIWLLRAIVAGAAAAILVGLGLLNLLVDLDVQNKTEWALVAAGETIFAFAYYINSRLILGRAPLARFTALAFAAVLTALAVLPASKTALGLGSLGFNAFVLVASAILFALPASLHDFRQMAEVREQHLSVVREVLDAVGLDPDQAMSRRPHEFSGGQCQRICIARALVLDPKLIICDEPVSALDVSVQAQILNLLEEMKQRYGLTLIFIAHDLAVVKNVSDRVAVMYLGKLCEVGPPNELYARPAHPYTAALLSSIPVPDPTVKPREESTLAGELPSPVAPPSGCRFRTRCPKAQDLCAQVEPKMRRVGVGHFVACHFPLVDAEEIPEGAVETRPVSRSAATQAPATGRGIA
jgi:oligopeptide/dipeptide ABC transporter ATP-binding protein